MNKIIVTMTTYGSRILTVHKAIESIWDGDLRPDAVVLWLAKDEFSGRKARNKLSPELKRLEVGGRVIIKYCEDIRSYKKLIPSLKAYPDELLVTADDDLIYHKDWLSHLIQEYQIFQHKKMIYSSIAYKLNYNRESGELTTNAIPVGPYETENLMISSGAGVLYPPHVLDSLMDEINKGDFIKLSPTSDESYISMLAYSHGIPVISLGKDYGEMYDEIQDTRESPLWRTNVVNRNQRLTELAKHFPDYYKHLTGLDGFREKENILVSMTSWSARIGNVHKVIGSILLGSMVPKKILLNLSEKEFPNEEKDLPPELIGLVEDGHVELNWVGENTKAFKKLVPSLYKYPEYLIVTVDDDLIYPTNFLRNLYHTYISNHRDHPITGGDSLIHNKLYTYYGGGTLSRLYDYGRILRGIYEGYAKPAVLESGLSFDDPIYTYSAYLNGTRFILSEDPICKVFEVADNSLSADPISKSGKISYEVAYIKYKRGMIKFIKENFPKEYEKYRESIGELEEKSDAQNGSKINLQKMELNPWVQHYNKFY